MSVQVENLEHNMAKLTIEVAAEELEKALDSAYQKQKKQISVPGFRKGKVPRAMIEKMYGAGVFYEDAANILMQQTYQVQLTRAVLTLFHAQQLRLLRLRRDSLSSTQQRLL